MHPKNKTFMRVWSSRRSASLKSARGSAVLIKSRIYGLNAPWLITTREEVSRIFGVCLSILCLPQRQRERIATQGDEVLNWVPERREQIIRVLNAACPANPDYLRMRVQLAFRAVNDIAGVGVAAFRAWPSQPALFLRDTITHSVVHMNIHVSSTIRAVENTQILNL